MTEKTLKFNNISVNMKKFHMSKKAIDLMSINIDRILVSYKFNFNEAGLLAIKKVKLLNHYVLFYLKQLGI